MKQPSRGVSFGTILMLAVTVMVVGLSAVTLPRLLGTADFDMDVSGAIAALSLDGAMPVLNLTDIPISDATEPPQETPNAVKPEISATPAPTAVPTNTPVPGGTVTLTLGGTVNIDDAIRKSAYYSDSGKYDFTEIMVLLQEEMRSDLTFVTLENITYEAANVSALNAPTAVMDMLAEAGVDILALGHPKALDKGVEGLRETIFAAQERGMTTLGAYANQADADHLRMFTVNNVNVAFLHYTESVTSAGKAAVKNDGADYALSTIKVNGAVEAMLAEVREARNVGADVVIVSLNWGKVSASKPTAEQKAIAQQLADAGADAIIGAGSRVVQPVTWLSTKDEDGTTRHALCAWSLGSLINESRKDGNVLGMLLQLQIYFDGKDVSFQRVCYTPTYIWRYKQDNQYYYRIAVSDQPAPDGMSDDQIGYMEKALRNLQKYLGDSPVTLRTK